MVIKSFLSGLALILTSQSVATVNDIHSSLITTHSCASNYIGFQDRLFTTIGDKEVLELLLSLIYAQDDDEKQKSFQKLKENWEDGLAGPLIELLRMSSDEWLLKACKELLSDKYKQPITTSFYDWVQWLWEQDIPDSAYYFDFKAELYKHIDPKFEAYFKNRSKASSIKLDEVLWGGVYQDGIPPLRYPEMITADDAKYLDDSNVVFGLVINGIARAYPKRILAWHEFFVDEFDGDFIAGVYCTLCGTVIAYDMTDDSGTFHNLGTSGFLYRSNKLMYDAASQSLWNTIEGSPVIGPLSQSDIQLKSYPIITTTWGEWKERHPESEVLSLNTGHQRDYSEGEAYRQYYSSDELMFPVPNKDHRLKNKDEVLVLREEGYKSDPLAISVKHLKKKNWLQNKQAATNFVVVTDDAGGARVYNSKSIIFTSYKNGKLIDQDGNQWTASEEYLSSKNGGQLSRLPSHNIFWFAWHNAYPNSRLIK